MEDTVGNQIVLFMWKDVHKDNLIKMYLQMFQHAISTGLSIWLTILLSELLNPFKFIKFLKE